MSKSFDFCVLGAGLAGLSISKHLIDNGASVCLIDTGEVASGASGTPLGLVNPATGRWGTKSWRAEECHQAVYEDLKEIQDHTPVRLFDKTGILRPAQDEEMAERMYDNYQKNEWPEDWCHWLDKKEVHDINPELHCVEGGMWLPHGLTVNVPTYLKSKAEYLTNQGLHIRTNADYSLKQVAGHYELILKDGGPVNANAVITTAGHQTKESKYWDFLPLHAIKGQVAVFESPQTRKFDYSISALGYIASISDTRFVAGSTYEHHFEDVEPDIEGLDYLTERLGGVYPSLFKEAKLVDQWAGVRASTPNKKPVVGAHPEIDNMYVFAGLGSKGLLYSAYLGNALSEYILHGSAIPKEVSVNRV
ncbi:NAD(P)/FAD-dependent oxidoreductase [Gracilimonas sp. BCB1]|uniref:NAD(P)/FAD-dependent oxidoreductase n=1 Tax=Gracilimonas sp. BCB1 TaxID=3152362 RepID=UPI0032D8F6FD